MVIRGSKICGHCREVKDVSEFSRMRGGDGYNWKCKYCERKLARIRRDSIRQANENRVIDYSSIEKRCSKCGTVKSGDEFYKNKCSRDGLHNYCKECSREYAKEYMKNNTYYTSEYPKLYRDKVTASGVYK